ncbi:MAG TPA: tRNA threonylcarbamoyladenosine dehydratase [Muribaculum sp.]|jgi:tRNA A37 threonylcarbamoyladenosine dehydratase|uniref:tRNA threonylcarbamoyladenosine dehydratase n=1 Tax=Heminiphilus faecis TaxID=2601703 RepID=A0ABV4CXF1_9BACT|nr:tRNA threonylcarbamoyladenosine dehydratase [Heminiphilus faecis]RLT77237.1 tRNA threonylcarbamoyladenosine dehydratase [bacterium J10(2018)]HRF68463.1 tRNA threonylcarbamoyladenosine dehydratase [Muribaculum sp.]
MSAITPFNERTALLLGEDAVARLAASRVAVVGIGGVGAYAVEMLARAGVGRLTLIDGDCVSPGNLNRQLPALHSTIGMPKAEVMKERVLDINPSCEVTAVKTFIKPDDAGDFVEGHDFVIDAIDAVAPKVALIEYCYRHKIDIIASMGAGGRTDPTQLRYADISDTFHDGLAREVRRRLKRNGITSGVKTVFSTEQPRRTALLYTDEIEFKTSSYGTVAWLPSMFGMMLAAYAVNRLTKS